MFRVCAFTALLLLTVSLQATPKRTVQVDVEVWKNGQLDSTPRFIVTEGERANMALSSDSLSFKMNVSPKNSPFSDKAFKIALEYIEIKNGVDQEPMNVNVESSSYSTAVVKFLPPTEGADPVELKISAKPL
jgi:hypothetical protein